MVLNAQPTADVTIGLSSSDTTEGTVAPASLTFTTGNWNVAQTVTVTGVDDALDDGDVAYTIRDGAGDERRDLPTTSNAADVTVTQHGQRRLGHHGDADDGPDDDGSGGRDGDVHGGAECAADAPT